MKQFNPQLFYWFVIIWEDIHINVYAHKYMWDGVVFINKRRAANGLLNHSKSFQELANFPIILVNVPINIHYWAIFGETAEGVKFIENKKKSWIQRDSNSLDNSQHLL